MVGGLHAAICEGERGEQNLSGAAAWPPEEELSDGACCQVVRGSCQIVCNLARWRLFESIGGGVEAEGRTKTVVFINKDFVMNSDEQNVVHGD